MNRIATLFANCRAANRAALIPFITAGDPDQATTVALMQTLVANGADLIELGVPFSDPVADGPVIQRASERALAQGTRLRDVLAMVRSFRENNTDTPVILMGYLNPIERMGYTTFAADAAAAGVDGVLVVDAPPEESAELVDALRSQGLDLIFLLAPTSDHSRMTCIAAVASGFVYYVSIKGVTGAASLDVAAVAAQLSTIRRHTELPVGVGFGIHDPATAAAVAQIADAVIVGSAIVQRIESLADQPAPMLEQVGAFVASLRKAMVKTANSAEASA